MLDGHLGRIDIAQRQIALFSANVKAVLSAPYRFLTKALKPEKEHSDKMSQERVSKPAETKWAVPILHASKKCGSERFRVNHQKQNAVMKRAVKPIPRMDDVKIISENPLSSESYMRTGTIMLWTRTRIEKRWTLSDTPDFIILCRFHLVYGMLQIRFREWLMMRLSQ